MNPLLLLSSALAQEVLMLRADEVHTVSGEVITDGAVLVRDGRIEAVGLATQIATPEGARVITGAVLTPGLIDAWTTAGLTGPYNNAGDQDHAERDAPVRPALRALDGYHAYDA